METNIKKLKALKQKAISQSKWHEAASLCNFIGENLQNMKQYDDALECHQEELNYCEIMKDRLGIAVANRKIGECYAELNNYKKALMHIKTFLDLAVELESSVEEQRAWATFGRTYFMKYSYETEVGDNESSLKALQNAEKAYLKALELSQIIKSALSAKEYAEMKARLLLNLGLVGEARGDISECANKIKGAIYLASKYDLFEDLYRCQYSLATFLQKYGQYAAALSLLDGGISSAEKLHDNACLCEALSTKALIQISMRNFEGGKLCLKKAYKIKSPVEDDHSRIVKHLKVAIGLCMLQQKLQDLDPGESLKRKDIFEKVADCLTFLGCYNLAIEYYESTLSCMEEGNCLLPEKAPIFYSLAITHYDNGNIDKAIENLHLELDCNIHKPEEQVKTLLKISDYLEEKKDTKEMEAVLLRAFSLCDNSAKIKLTPQVVERLVSTYESCGNAEKVAMFRGKLRNLPAYSSSEDNESETDVESQEPFAEYNFSDMSNSDSEKEGHSVSQMRRRTRKPTMKVNEKGETPLHQACISGNLTVVKRLVEIGCSINAQDNCGWTPLHEASNHGFYDIVEYLVDHGASINHQGGKFCQGVTPLHDASSCGNLDIMQLLISKGASVTIVDENGETPLDALLKWKTRTELDHETLILCHTIEDELRSKMALAGLPAHSSNKESGNITCSSTNVEFGSERSMIGEKRARSSSSSDWRSSGEDEDNDCSTYFPRKSKSSWKEGSQAKSEYKAVMSSLRRSAVSDAPIKEFPSKPNPIPSLIDEKKVLDNWLIKDTHEIPRSKKKGRKMARLNVRTSKSLYNYLEPKSDSNERSPLENKEIDNVMIVEDDSNSSESSNTLESSKKVEFEKSSSTNSASCKQESHSLSFCLKVRISSKLILVPIPEDNCSVGWLSEQAAQRYHDLVGSRPHLTLMTKDGALLSNSDVLKSLFTNNEEVGSSVEFWEKPSLDKLYTQLCNRRGASPCSTIEEKFRNLAITNALLFENCCIPPLQMNLIFSSLRDCKTLQQIDLSGTVITDKSVNDIILCFPTLSSLVSLNLSSCCLTSESIKCISDYFLKDLDLESKLPKLKTLCLRHNLFNTSCCTVFQPIFKLSSLALLDLYSCNLSLSFFEKMTPCSTHSSIENLEEFNIAGNNLSDRSIYVYLKYLPRKNLRKLNFSHIGKRNLNTSIHLTEFLSKCSPQLKEINLEGSNLRDDDLLVFSENLQMCPQLEVINISANPLLSCNAILVLLKNIHNGKLCLTSILLTGTCIWDTESLSSLVNLVTLNNIKHLVFDIEYSLHKQAFKSWEEYWGHKAICITNGFCELYVSE